jgi:hypothetical protein
LPDEAFVARVLKMQVHTFPLYTIPCDPVQYEQGVA